MKNQATEMTGSSQAMTFPTARAAERAIEEIARLPDARVAGMERCRHAVRIPQPSGRNIRSRQHAF
jgi:hypothetical protein